MPGIIVSDTSCLILLEKLGKTDLLNSLFGTITVTQIVANEYGGELPEFVRIENPVNKTYQKKLESNLDPGEASSIALALEKEDCLLIIDEIKARKEAEYLGVKITGSIGILILSKEKGLIPSISEIMERINQTDFRISESLVREALRRSGE